MECTLIKLSFVSDLNIKGDKGYSRVKKQSPKCKRNTKSTEDCAAPQASGKRN